MEIGCEIKTLKEKIANENLDKVIIPKGTFGTVCEIHDTWVYVEVCEKDNHNSINGVYAFEFNEIEEIHKFTNFNKTK